jgi:hypothetical protein
MCSQSDCFEATAASLVPSCLLAHLFAFMTLLAYLKLMTSSQSPVDEVRN